MTERWTVVEAAACDGGLQIARIEPWEDCCRAARRYGGTCWHGAAEGGGGATYEECREAIEAEEERRYRLGPDSRPAPSAPIPGRQAPVH